LGNEAVGEELLGAVEGSPRQFEVGFSFGDGRFGLGFVQADQQLALSTRSPSLKPIVATVPSVSAFTSTISFGGNGSDQRDGFHDALLLRFYGDDLNGHRGGGRGWGSSPLAAGAAFLQPGARAVAPATMARTAWRRQAVKSMRAVSRTSLHGCERKFH